MLITWVLGPSKLSIWKNGCRWIFSNSNITQDLQRHLGARFAKIHEDQKMQRFWSIMAVKSRAFKLSSLFTEFGCRPCMQPNSKLSSEPSNRNLPILFYNCLPLVLTRVIRLYGQPNRGGSSQWNMWLLWSKLDVAPTITTGRPSLNKYLETWTSRSP